MHMWVSNPKFHDEEEAEDDVYWVEPLPAVNEVAFDEEDAAPNEEAPEIQQCYIKTTPLSSEFSSSVHESSAYSGSRPVDSKVSRTDNSIGSYPKTSLEKIGDLVRAVRHGGLERRLAIIAGVLFLSCLTLVGISIATGGVSFSPPIIDGGINHGDSEPPPTWYNGSCPETTEVADGWIKYGEIACQPLELYTSRQLDVAVREMRKGIDSVDGVRGSLRAGLDLRERPCPEYFYTWARDQAVVYSALLDRYILTKDSKEAADMKEYMIGYAIHAHTWYVLNVKDETDEYRKLIGLAYAKVTFDGVGVQNGCDPQNDGPALRAIQLMRFAEAVAEREGQVEGDRIRSTYLYNTTLDDSNVNPVRRDLEWLADNYDLEDCEPWEEIKGRHFYDRIVAYTAMKRGAKFARKMGNIQLAEKLEFAVDSDKEKIDGHWKESLQTIQPERENRGGRLEDIQSVYAMAHAYLTEDDFFGPGDTRMMANALYTLRSFNAYWKINEIGWKGHHDMGPAIGRYVHDSYGGGCTVPIEVCPEGGGWRSTCRGNAWHLATSAMAEFFYRVVEHYQTKGSIILDRYNINTFYWFGAKSFLFDLDPLDLPITYDSTTREYKLLLTTLLHAGDSFLKRNKFHTNSEMILYEQFNGVSGAQHSTAGLTWAYAAVATAIEVRDRINPRKMIQEDFSISDDPNGRVFIDIVVTQIPSEQDSYYPVLLFNKEDDCAKGVRLAERRKVNHLSDWSVFIEVPKNSLVTLRAAAIVDLGNGETQCELSSESYELKTYDKNPIQPFFVEWECSNEKRCPLPPPPTSRAYQIIVSFIDDADNQAAARATTRMEILGGVRSKEGNGAVWDEKYNNILTWTPCESPVQGVRSGNQWVFEFEVPLEVEQFEFKAVRYDDNTYTCDNPGWEILPPGSENLILQVAEWESPGRYQHVYNTRIVEPLEH